MAKRKETLDIEAALQKDTRIKRIYGCEEITIGFYNNGHGNEIVDFMTMDSKGIIKCYEIKSLFRILNLMQRNPGMVITIIWWLVKNCGMSIKITYLKIHQNILEF